MNKKPASSIVPAGIVLSIISGILLWLSFPPAGFSYAAWVAFVPLFYALMRLAPTRALFGAYYATALGVWLAATVAGVPPDMRLMYVAPFAGFAAVYLATFMQRDLLLRNNYRFFTAITATMFTAFEFWTQYSPFAQVGSIGTTQYKMPEVIQVASILGVPGITILIIVFNCTLALAAANLRSLGKVKLQLLANLVIICAFSAVNLYLMYTPLPASRTVKVAAAQMGHVPEDAAHPAIEDWHKLLVNGEVVALSNKSIDILAPMTMSAARRGAKLVVWPEEVLGVDPTLHYEIGNRVADLAVKSGAYIVAPYASYATGTEKMEDADVINGLVVYSPLGKVIHRYLKQHRITIFGVERGPEGDSSKVLDSDIGRMALMICYDADFSDVPSAYAAAGAEFFVIPSDDLSMFITRRHPGLLLFRAVEHRRSLIKADMVHGTLIVDPKGRILADPPDGLRMAIADVPLSSVKTPFRWASVVFGVGATVFFAGFLVAAGIGGRSKNE